jgi:hypothetical protein
MSNVMFMRRAIYQFKKDYGTLIRYFVIKNSSTDTKTGARLIEKDMFELPAVLLPQDLVRKFMQDIGYLAANKNFTYGALNDYLTSKFLILDDDLPKGLAINLNGYIVWNHKRLERISFESMENGVAYLLTAKASEGGVPYDKIPATTQNKLVIGQAVTYELN